MYNLVNCPASSLIQVLVPAPELSACRMPRGDSHERNGPTRKHVLLPARALSTGVVAQCATVGWVGATCADSDCSSLYLCASLYRSVLRVLHASWRG